MHTLFDSSEFEEIAQHWQIEDDWRLLNSTRIDHELDVFDARRAALQLALQADFRQDQAYHLVTAMTELGNNIVFHSVGGYVFLKACYARCLQSGQRQLVALKIIAEDLGPGIMDIPLAMKEGYSSTKSMGCGLSGVKRLMDEVNLQSDHAGTQVEAILWVNEHWRTLHG